MKSKQRTSSPSIKSRVAKTAPRTPRAHANPAMKLATSAAAMAARARRQSKLVAVLETTEARLERKAAVADRKIFTTRSLGQMSRSERHKLLYGA